MITVKNLKSSILCISLRGPNISERMTYTLLYIQPGTITARCSDIAIRDLLLYETNCRAQNKMPCTAINRHNNCNASRGSMKIAVSS